MKSRRGAGRIGGNDQAKCVVLVLARLPDLGLTHLPIIWRFCHAQKTSDIRAPLSADKPAHGPRRHGRAPAGIARRAGRRGDRDRRRGRQELPYYPPAVTRVRAVEPEPGLRSLVQIAGRQAPIPVEVTDGVAERLPVPDASLDAAVFAFTLCTFPDPDAALREAYRALKPGGQLRFLEHVRGDSPGLVRIQRLLDATVWPLLFAGCHLSRDTAQAIKEAGFTIDQVDEFLFPQMRSPVSFHIRGTARKPAAESAKDAAISAAPT